MADETMSADARRWKSPARRTFLSCTTMWVAGFTFLGIFAGARAADVQERTASPEVVANHDLDKSPLLRTAEHLGLLAGEAEYCKIENDELDQFIALSHARLARMARKDPLSIAGARLEFNAYAALGRAEGPKEGCTDFLARFRSARRSLQ